MARPLKFKNEKSYVSFLVENASKWVGDFYHDKIKELKVNSTITFNKFGANKPRIDLEVLTIGGKRIGIECKNPSQDFHEISRSVSQLLAYAIIAEESGKPFTDLAIITSSESDIHFKIAKRFNLPIRTFYVDMNVHGELS